jgi:Mrp family chromosome partitioning ATPase/uncharacterized protein involved in exopolysaccharide biosynthesis
VGSLSTESTPRERLARLVVLMKRTRRFARSTSALLVLGLSVSLALALTTKRAWRSETTVLYRDGIQTGAPEGESAAARAARLGPKLKDLVYARPKLEEVIQELGLFPEKRRKSMLDAIEEMTTAVGFRARASDSYVISFTYEDPAIARDVTARLATLMIEEYNRQNLDSATLTRDFLRRKLAEAEGEVDEASRALATFLAHNPQFQWGVNDSPYAPAPGGTGPAPMAPRPFAPRASAPREPLDPETAILAQRLARVEAELAGGSGAKGIGAPTTPLEAQRARDAAAQALAAAESALAEKLLSVKPAHPDAVAAEARVSAARAALAAAEAALARAKAGIAAASPPPPNGDLAPERRAELEKERSALRRQLAARRDRIARGGAPAGKPRGQPDKEPDVVELETEWHRLRMDLDRARERLRTIQTSARAAELSRDAVAKQGRAEMMILEPAYLPSRPDRGRGRVFFAGAAMTLFFALGYAAARVLLDDALLDEGDVAALGGPQVIVAMPHLPAPAAPPPERAIVPAAPPADDDDGDAPPSSVAPPGAGVPSERGLVVHPSRGKSYPVAVVFDDPEVELLGADVSPDAVLRAAASPPEALAALRVLRHRLEQKRGDGSFVVSVMSPGPAEGKTSLALRLAITLSEAERARVVLVEGNFERPRLATTLGLCLPPRAGFSAQLYERMSGHGMAWGVVRLLPSLSLLAEPGRHAAHPHAIHSTHFEAAIAALRRSYEYVVIDGPGVAGSGDANVIEAASDAVLLAVRAGRTKGAALSRATRQLGERRVLGVVLNDVDPPSAARSV